MFNLNEIADKQEYIQHMDQKCMLGKKQVTVKSHVLNTRSGSYSRGFKFHNTTIGILADDYGNYSADHGETWWFGKRYAVIHVKRKKIVLFRSTDKEFAYDAIQNINTRYGY